MSNKAYNKVIVNGNTIIDLTSDTATADKVLSGFTFHDRTGEIQTGSCSFDADTSDDDVAVAEILYGKKAHARGTLLTGTMPNRGGVTGIINTVNDSYSIQQGYHDGSGTVSIDSTEQGKLIPTNIRNGVTILGVQGSMTGSEDINAQSKTVTPSFSSQTILPSTGYDYLSQVTVNAIPVSESDNAAGGKTITIG